MALVSSGTAKGGFFMDLSPGFGSSKAAMDAAGVEASGPRAATTTDEFSASG
jgi:hypothetical protein